MITAPFQRSSTPPTAPDVSLVIPAYNESDRIGNCLDQLTSWITTRPESFEIIVVDDGSSDDTAAVAERWSIRHPIITVIHERHRGKANAVLAGLSAAQGAIAGYLDVDLATPISTWDECATAFRAGADVAIASREGIGAIRVGEPWYRHVMGRAFNSIVRVLLLPGLHDTQCGFKFFTRHALNTILSRTTLYRNSDVVSRPRVTAFDVELLFIARRHHLRITVIPVTWTYGEHTKVNPLTDTLQNLSDVLKVRVNGWLGKYA